MYKETTRSVLRIEQLLLSSGVKFIAHGARLVIWAAVLL